MSVLKRAKHQVLNELKSAVGGGFSPSIKDIEYPPDSAMGDLAFPCFSLAKHMKQPPDEVASEIAAKIGPKELIGSIKAVGPYVNFTLKASSFGTELLGEIESAGSDFGRSDVGNGKKIMVEFANLNTHKDVHIGHLRNLFLGQMLVDVLRATGYDVVPVAYINDLGAHVAKSVWAILKFHADETVPKDERVDFLRDVYIEATKKVEENPSYKEEVGQVFRHLEEQTGREVATWKETHKWSTDMLEEVYDELGLTIETWYFESQVYKKTKKAIEDLIARGIVVESQGAWIVNLENVDLGVNLLVKSDGTLLYNAKDIGLALKKEENYHPVKSIYVVDARQSHALQQLFATLKLMGFDRDLYHLSYEFVTLKDGAMSSRTGNVIRYELLRDALLERSRKETATRHDGWTAKRIDKVARAVAFSAMRFHILKHDPDKQIVFDFDDALSFDGFTGPYLLYTYARIQSVFKKAGKLKADWSATRLEHSLEHQLIVHLSRYEEVVFDISVSYHLNALAQYLFELAKLFSAYYNDVPILRADESVAKQRLALLQSVRIVLKNGLTLMGIQTVEEM